MLQEDYRSGSTGPETLGSSISAEGDISLRRTQVSISNALFALSYLTICLCRRHFCPGATWKRLLLSARAASAGCAGERATGGQLSGDEVQPRKQSSGVCDKSTVGNPSEQRPRRWPFCLLGKFYQTSQTNGFHHRKRCEIKVRRPLQRSPHSLVVVKTSLSALL